MSIIGAETIGTALLILLGDGVVAAVLLTSSKAQNSGWIVITWGWGMAVMFAVLAVGQFSGAHLNPAVTLGFAVIGNTEWSDVPKYLIGEFAGAMHRRVSGGRGVFESLEGDGGSGAQARGVLDRSGDPQHGVEPHDRDHRHVRAGVRRCWRSSRTSSRRCRRSRSAGSSSACWCSAIGLSLGGPTGYAINPARDLGPRIAHAILPIPGKGGSDWGYAWIPVVGPIIGGILGALAFDALLPRLIARVS